MIGPLLQPKRLLFIRWTIGVGLLILVVIVLRSANGQPPNASVDGDTIDPAKFRMTFDENFKTLDVSAWGPGTRWIAHTPWSGDFGDAKFDDPGPGGPFSITSNGLEITARQDAQGGWYSGLLSSMDSIGPAQTGFAQRYGYFEMCAKFPDGPGVWPAFWLIGTDRRYGTAEFDVVEFYGAFNNKFHTTIHFWGDNHNSYGMGQVVTVPPGMLSRQYNTYGVLILPTVIKAYFNRQEIWSMPTPPEFRTPMYILVDLALGGGWPINHLKSPQVMDIQYIRAYQTN